MPPQDLTGKTKDPRRRFARRVALAYFAAALAWIVLSDLALSQITIAPGSLTAYGMAKGALFVLVTSALLYWAVLKLAPSLGAAAAAMPTEQPLHRLVWNSPTAVFSAGATVVLLIIIGLFVIESIKKQEAAREGLEAILALKADQLARWHAGKRAVANSYRGARVLRDQMAALQIRDDPVVRAALADRIEEIRRNLDIEAVLVLDATARLLATTGDKRYASLSAQFQERARAAIARDEALVGFLHRATQGEDELVLVDNLVPMEATAGGAVFAGALVLREDARKHFFKLVREFPGKWDTGEALLAQRDGSEVVFLSDVRHVADAALRLRRPLADANLPAARAAFGESVIEGIDYRGIEVIAAARAIAGTDWLLIAKVDKREILSEVRESLAVWSLLVLAFSLFTSLGVGALWREQRALAALREQHLRAERKAVEKHLDLMSRYANDIILLHDSSGRIVEANDRAVERYGYTREKFLELSAADLRPEEERAEVAHRVAEVMRLGHRMYETRHRTAGGEVFPVEVSARRVSVEGSDCFQAIIRDISERKHAEAALRESQEKLLLFVEHAPAAIAMLDANMHYIAASKRWFSDYGVDDRAIVGHSHYEVFPEIPERWKEIHRRCLAGATERCEADPFVRADGRTDWIRWEIRPWRRSGGAIGGLIIFSEVITERERARARIEKLERLRLSLSAVNRAIVHATDEFALYDDLCRIMVKHAGYKLAWIGLIDGATGTLAPTVLAGTSPESIAGVRVSVRGDPPGREPISIAVRESRTVVCNDIFADANNEPWFDIARRLGVHSCVALPIHKAGFAAGVLAVHAETARYFDAEAVALLEEATADLSFALDVLAHNRELRESEARFRAMLEQSVAAVYVIQGGRIVYANPRMREIFGYGADESFDPDPLAHVAPIDRRQVADQMVRRMQGEPSASYSFVALRRNGGVFTFGISAQVATYEGKAAIIAIGQDITEKERAEAERNDHLRRVEAQLAALTGLTGSAHLVSGDVEEFARELTEAAAQAAGVERANVWLFNDAETELACIDLYEATPARHSAGATLAQAQFGPEFAALKSAAYVDANEPLTDARTAGYAESYLKPLRITSMLDAVVRFSGKNLGLLCLEHVDRAHRWHPDEITFACQLADKLTLAITNRDRQHTQQKLRRSLEDSIQAIAATVEMRDPYTAGHERRVAELAAAIGAEMALPPFMVEGIHFGAMIHDLGKIQIPAEILSKPTRISPVEFELIKGHAQAGYDILKGIDFPWPVAEMARQHHERLDGSGYPQGLKGDSILLEARVLAVADVVEAMASHRPYRPGLGIDKALAEIERGRGTVYDPPVANACLRLFREKSYQLPD